MMGSYNFHYAIIITFLWIINDGDSYKFNSVHNRNFARDTHLFNSAMKVIDKNYLSEYIRLLLHNSMTQSYIWIDIARLADNNVHKMKDV